MATINDLGIPDFSKMSDEELQALVIESRKRRRNPPVEIKEKSIKKAQAKAKKGKAVPLMDVKKMLDGIDPSQAQELLNQLRGL